MGPAVSSIAPWNFTTQPAAARRPSVILFVFGTGPLGTSAELSMTRFGAPSPESLATCDVKTVTRGMDARWFDAWRSGSLRAIAQQDLGGGIAALDAADHVHVIACEPGDVADLTYLQAAWALARFLIARGGSVVLDAHAMRFTAADNVQLPGEPLDVSREVRVIYETDSTRPDGAHALHTRGMRKFGAPDLVALCTDGDAALVGSAITELAEQVACGTDLATPAHVVEVAPSVQWVAVEDEHRLADVLQLNNSARVLVDSTGHDLLGVVARIGTRGLA
jgi:hypothetical protein